MEKKDSSEVEHTEKDTPRKLKRNKHGKSVIPNHHNVSRLLNIVNKNIENTMNSFSKEVKFDKEKEEVEEHVEDTESEHSHDSDASEASHDTCDSHEPQDRDEVWETLRSLVNSHEKLCIATLAFLKLEED